MRHNLTQGLRNIVRESLEKPDKILIPPPHIKLGVMKLYVKVLSKDGNCFVVNFPVYLTQNLRKVFSLVPQLENLFQMICLTPALLL